MDVFFSFFFVNLRNQMYLNICDIFYLGEQFVCDARGVIHFTPLSDRKISTSGILTITTFKLSFVTNTDDHSFDDCYQQNLLLGSNEICLSAIDTIYQIGERSKKKLHGQIVSGKVKELLIMCKVRILC